MKRRAACLATLILTGAALAPPAAALPADASTFSELRWRLVGPHRAGRIWWVEGVASDPATYYAGTPAGALWKSTNGGVSWASISDHLPTTGVGAVAVARSQPNVLYVGTGSNILGSGVYRSSDAGSHWQPAGLADTKFITGLLVDPRDPDVVIAAAGSGGNFGTMVFYNNNPSPTRGVYRTSDGGRTWAHTLFVDNDTPAVDLARDPARPDLIYASLSNGLYRSDDGGRSWSKLPASGMAAAGATIAVAPGTGGRRVYAMAGGRRERGLFRSDDGGATFSLMTSRLASAGGHLYVDPGNPDVVYTMGTSVYRSTDGGRTLEAIKGAPGGDDPHSMWIDPKNPRRMIMGADQGPAITVDGGQSWTPWYTMPNGEFYFLSTDQQFPYRIYAAQQDSGTVSILSRSDFGAIRPNDWYSISGYEQGHIFSDPLNPRYVYSHGGGHVIIRFDRVTGQSGPVFTPGPDDRWGPRPGMDLSTKDPHWMFVGSQFVYASNDRVTWNRISGDLTARTDPAAATRPPGTIVALNASPLDLNVLWAGTSNGLIHVTRDAGRSWTDVSVPRLREESSLVLWSMETSSHDPAVAYAAAIDLSDRHGPALFRTGDFGASWTEIDASLPQDVPTRVVREDPKQSSLLYAGTQHGVFVSFDRGANWQPLQLDLPPAPINDLTVHGDDLIAATWGRAIWALDNLTPLRQVTSLGAETGPAFLFEPAPSVRVRWDNNQDTPLPPEVPQGQNPPDGVAIDYYLREAARGPISISIRDARGALVREYEDTAPPEDVRMPNVPAYWFKKPSTLKTSAGMHRLVWDLRYPTPPSLEFEASGAESDTIEYGIIAPAVKGETLKQQPIGSLVTPGVYQVTLTAAGRSWTRPITVTNDPRSEATAADLAELSGAEQQLSRGIARIRLAIDQVRDLREAARGAGARSAAGADAAAAFDLAAVATITDLAGNRRLAGRLADLQFADLRPTASTIAAVNEGCGHADETLGRYRDFLSKDLARLNVALTRAGGAAIQSPAPVTGPACGPEAR